MDDMRKFDMGTDPEIDKLLLDGAELVKPLSDRDRKIYLERLRDSFEIALGVKREEARIAQSIGDEAWMNRLREGAKNEWKALQEIRKQLE